MRMIDLVGMTFGNFTVISRDQEDRMKWIVKCRNGHIQSRYGQNLKTLRANQCTVCKEKQVPLWMVNSINRRGGNLTVEILSKLYGDQNGRCAMSGREISFSVKPLKITASLDRIDSSIGYITNNIQWVHKDINWMKGSLSVDRFRYLCTLVANKDTCEIVVASAKYCPLIALEPKFDCNNMIGNKFGELTVIEKAISQSPYPSWSRWVVSCSCGKVFTAAAYKLVDRKRGIKRCRRCSCLARRLNGKRIPARFYHDITTNARKRGLVFDKKTLSKDWLYALYLKQGRKCALSGVDIVFADTNDKHVECGSTASLDRIDSTKGYGRDNVQWTHKEINMMKQDFPEPYFIELCNLVASH